MMLQRQTTFVKYIARESDFYKNSGVFLVLLCVE